MATPQLSIAGDREAPGLVYRSSAILLCLCVGLFVLSLCIGPVPIGVADVWQALLGAESDASPLAIVIKQIRLPRACLALLIGASLAMSGAALQSLVRNPLAEPGLIGVSSLSALGAVLAFYTGVSATFAFALPLGGIVGALVSVVVLFTLAGRGLDTLNLILAGIAINSIGGALTSLVLNLSPNPFAVYEILFWLLGSLANRSFEHLWMLLPLTLAGCALMMAAARDLDAFALGEDVAKSLGVNLERVRAMVVLGTALAVGASVAVAGIIGFVGLVVPHMLRPIVGHHPQVLLPMSALGGAALVLAADISARTIASNAELKLGVVTALIGAPFFLYLVLSARRVPT